MSPKKHCKAKSILVRKDIKQKELAAELGVSRSTVSGVLNGHHRSKRIQEYIAQKLNMDYEILWGKVA